MSATTRPPGRCVMPDAVQMSYLAWLADEDATRQANYTAYRDYYDGDHDTQLTARQRAYLELKAGVEFNTNYCPIVVDALARRLNVTGFECDTQADTLKEWWQHSRMDAVQKVAHLSACRDGDSYVMVEWDNEQARPRFTAELAYNGTEGVKVHYSRERRGVIDFASKRWNVQAAGQTGTTRRLNLYYPDRIEKYISQSGAFEGNWQPYQDTGDGNWPIPWRDGAGRPLGVPVVHFRNNDQGYDYGTSELKKVLPLQNALNKSIIDLLGAADTTAFRNYVMLGDDPTGLKVSPGSWIYSTRPPGGEEGVSVQVLPGEDMRPLIALKDSFAVEIARVTETPLSSFQLSGQVAAEGTLKQQESGLVARCVDRQVAFGNAWEDALYLARRLWNTYGPGGLDETEDIDTQWSDAQTRNETEFMAGLTAKSAMGVPQEQLWRELGYDEQQIADWVKAKEASAAQAMLNAMRAFDQNQGNGVYGDQGANEPGNGQKQKDMTANGG
jgi:hypothetical protein